MEKTKHFFVTGLPRSRTAWFANYLTTDRSFCYHTAHVFVKKGHYKEALKLPHYDYTGDSSFTIGLTGCYSEYPSSPILVIDRPFDEVLNFFLSIFGEYMEKKRIELVLEILRDLNSKIPGAMVVRYQDINKEIKEIWKHLVPDLPYNPLRTSMLLALNTRVNEFDDFLAAIRMVENY